jgi:coproporphyrinogen III oxidase
MLTTAQKQTFKTFVISIQDRLAKAFEEIDGSAKIQHKTWQRPEGGGGRMAVIRGAVVEKAGVNVSEVQGAKYPAIDGDYKDQPFWVTGVSTITHMFNPYAPIGHMNVRLFEVGDTFWFGGGADLTPCKPFAEDTQKFHEVLKAACALKSPDSYEQYKKWCDEYFYIQHRQSIRGVGGVFFDYVKGSFDELFPFVKAVAEGYVEVFTGILKHRKNHPFTEAEKEEQLYWRGRYAEYNLVYDRGTKFGLMTGGNIEAIFVSLPPVVKW